MLKGASIRIVGLIMSGSFFISPVAALAASSVFEQQQALTNEVSEISEKIIQRAKNIDELTKQSDVYRKNIQLKQAELINLSNQLSVLDNTVAKTNLDIRTKEEQIAKTNLEIVETQLLIQKRGREIVEQEEKISKLLRLMQRQDQKSYLEIILMNESFSKFFDQLKYIQNIQSQIQTALDEIKGIKSKLEENSKLLEQKNKSLLSLKSKLEENKSKLEFEKSAKQLIIDQTQNSEQRFKNLLAQVKLEKRSLDTEIAELEFQIKQKLSQRRDSLADLDTPAELIWPLPFQGIVTYFHDPEYPFRRWVGEHSGLDLRTLINGLPSNGVPVRAAANGTVIKVIQGGRYTGNAVYMAHGGGIMSVYLHLSRVFVAEDEFVPVGKVIANSGGLPGTAGAGLSSGPHLHFEVRQNGIPVNPLEYLSPPPAFIAAAKRQ